MFVLILFSIRHLHFDTLELIYKVVLAICCRLAGTDKENALLCAAKRILPQTGDRSAAIITSRGSYIELMLLNLGPNFSFNLFYFSLLAHSRYRILSFSYLLGCSFARGVYEEGRIIVEVSICCS